MIDTDESNLERLDRWWALNRHLSGRDTFVLNKTEDAENRTWRLARSIQGGHRQWRFEPHRNQLGWRIPVHRLPKTTLPQRYRQDCLKGLMYDQLSTRYLFQRTFNKRLQQDQEPRTQENLPKVTDEDSKDTWTLAKDGSTIDTHGTGNGTLRND